ncbi:diaminopropionate ammonia-lyase [Clostridium minihomine]|uniref:diaminopropionate ammonia-lyase n=1 Tax=Clostridium minihomine TaxID=2045012 RepID=UPI000C7668F3|nr:diaminopropionate ammonia-lyase [Clostridium minihomine]
MGQDLKWKINTMPKTDDRNLPLMSESEVRKARTFHQSFPQYSITPLADLNAMAEHLGIGRLAVKDESYRFGLNAFKVLGGSYAMARYIAEETGKDISNLPYHTLISDELRKEFGQATFFSATDGNHGRGVAWAANKMRQKAVIYMPKGSTQTRLNNILAEGATATIETVNYDECVRMAAAAASKTPHGVVVQDTAWEGYEKIPAWIMQGYGTMANEADEQLGERPTHVFVQAGVGSLAGAVVGYFTNKYKENPPTMVVVEADVAACLYQGAMANDGNIRIVDGDMDTIMAGLACGEPNITSWDILKNHAACFIVAKDPIAARGMRMLAAPARGDIPVISGESGAAPFGALVTIMTDEGCRELRDALKLDKDSRVLLFSTEGDTDPERYKNIVWEGKER